MDLSGIHHLTAITAQARENLRFYTDTMGLRLVKKTVNQDDTSAYHLFYADGLASPGTDLTFFDWPTGRERRGTGTVGRTGLRIAPGSVDYWLARLRDHGVAGMQGETDGRVTVDFEDPEGQRFRLTDDGGAGEAHPWAESPVPAEHQIRGLGPITLSVADAGHTARMLTEVMNMRHVRDYLNGGEVHVFEMGPGGPAAELHVAVRPDLPPAQQGAGGVHHVAFRTPDRQGLQDWAARVKDHGIRTSGEVERYYFRSLYFRDPSGILYEIATDGPGFTVDEPLESLGETLSLPPFLEDKREKIEAGLNPLD